MSTTLKTYLTLAAFLLVSLGVGAIGGSVTAGSVATWYPTLSKPPFNPPDWIFGPVWTALYILMAFAAWRVWRTNHPNRGPALFAYAAQLALNLAWSFIFFGMQKPGAALVEIALLLVAVAGTMVLFWRIDRVAGLLFVPYLAWVMFASVLNASIWWLN
ncbi:TspO/MBR family protein [Tepidamorphus sp. 3E244]|uniref:TspO/MBR family protein n=1 Tax=Tepidamorphus sp. 3E244 TaxID=3385498 RepID=UPI0038FC291D